MKRLLMVGVALIVAMVLLISDAGSKEKTGKKGGSKKGGSESGTPATEVITDVDPIVETITTSAGKTYTLSAEKTKISVDGKEGAKISDLTTGMKVTVTISQEDAKLATAVVATTAAPPSSSGGKKGGGRSKGGTPPQ